MKEVFNLLTQPTCPEHVFWARHGVLGGWECRPSRMPIGNQTFLDSSATIKIDRKCEPTHGALPALNSVLLELGGGPGRAHVLERPYGIRGNVLAVVLDRLGPAL